MINIFTDSTSDLGPELAKRFNIHTIPLYVYAGGKTYRDGVDITLEELYRSVEETGELPKTSAPTVADFQQAFSAPGEHIFFSISNRLSATFQNAGLARDSLPGREIHLIDSLNLSTGIGLLAFKAADLREEGLPAAEIAARMREWIPRVRTAFVIETLDYLHKGGRCSAMQNLMGSLLHIRPVIEVRPDGTLGVRTKTRGSRQKAFQVLLDDLRANLGQVDPARAFVTHSGCPQDADALKAEVEAMGVFGEVLVTRAGSVIASHCGPETIGVLYLTK